MPDCPHCGAPLTDGHRYCRHCTRRAVDFRLCEHCGEPAAADAPACPHCGHVAAGPKEKAARALDLEVRASPLGACLTGGSPTALFLPPIIRVHAGRITVTRWTFFGLRCHQQEIQVTRVASVRYTRGIIWGGLLVETFGGATEDLSEKGLHQNDARHMAEQLKSCLED